MLIFPSLSYSIASDACFCISRKITPTCQFEQQGTKLKKSFRFLSNYDSTGTSYGIISLLFGASLLFSQRQFLGQGGGVGKLTFLAGASFFGGPFFFSVVPSKTTNGTQFLIIFFVIFSNFSANLQIHCIKQKLTKSGVLYSLQLSQINCISDRQSSTVSYELLFKYFFTVPKSIGFFTMSGQSTNRNPTQSTGVLKSQESELSNKHWRSWLIFLASSFPIKVLLRKCLFPSCISIIKYYENLERISQIQLDSLIYWLINDYIHICIKKDCSTMDQKRTPLKFAENVHSSQKSTLWLTQKQNVMHSSISYPQQTKHDLPTKTENSLIQICRAYQKENSILKQEICELKCVIERFNLMNEINGQSKSQSERNYTQQLKAQLKRVEDEQRQYKNAYFESYQKKMWQISCSVKYLYKCYMQSVISKKSESTLKLIENFFNKDSKTDAKLTSFDRLLNLYEKQVSILNTGSKINVFQQNLADFETQIQSTQNSILRSHIAHLTKAFVSMGHHFKNQLHSIKSDLDKNSQKIGEELNKCMKKYFNNELIQKLNKVKAKTDKSFSNIEVVGPTVRKEKQKTANINIPSSNVTPSHKYGGMNHQLYNNYMKNPGSTSPVNAKKEKVKKESFNFREGYMKTFDPSPKNSLIKADKSKLNIIK